MTSEMTEEQHPVREIIEKLLDKRVAMTPVLPDGSVGEITITKYGEHQVFEDENAMRRHYGWSID